MKILKAALLTFIILFTINNVNAQISQNNVCDTEFTMQVVPTNSFDDSKACFIATVTSDSPEILFINGNRFIRSVIEQTSLSTTICLDRPPLSETFSIIECGVMSNSNCVGNSNDHGVNDSQVVCREGCLVVITP